MLNTKVNGFDSKSILDQLKVEDNEIKEISREEKLFDISFSRIKIGNNSEKEWVALSNITDYFKIPKKYGEIENFVLADERFDGHATNSTNEKMLLDKRGVYLIADVIKNATDMDRKSYEAMMTWSKKMYDDEQTTSVTLKTQKPSKAIGRPKIMRDTSDTINEAREIVLRINDKNMRQFDADIGIVTPLIDIANSIGLDRAMAIKVVNRNKLEFKDCSIELVTEAIGNKRPFGNPRLLCINKYGFIRFINHIQASRMKDVDSQSMVLKLKDIGAKLYGDLITGDLVVSKPNEMIPLPGEMLPGVDHATAYTIQFNIAKELVSAGLVTMKEAYKTALTKASRLETVSVTEWINLIDGYKATEKMYNKKSTGMKSDGMKVDRSVKMDRHLTTRNLAQRLNVIPRRSIKAVLEEMGMIKLRNENIGEVTPTGKKYADRVYTTDNQRVIVWWKPAMLDMCRENIIASGEQYLMLESR